MRVWINLVTLISWGIIGLTSCSQLMRGAAMVLVAMAAANIAFYASRPPASGEG